MFKLSNAVNAWGTEKFNHALKDEIKNLNPQLLPLQQGMSQGSYVSNSKLGVMIVGVSEEAGIISAKAGIFYSSSIAGCNCADDPTPVDEQTEYCEVQFEISRETAEATVKLLS